MIDAPETQANTKPNPDLRKLDRLVGTWKIAGGAQGTATYEWMEGGFFLIQHVKLEQYGQKTKGIEIIGHERPFGAEPSEDVTSRFYDSMGNTLDYVYEVRGHAHDLGWREGLAGLLHGSVQRRRRHRHRRVGVPGRRLPLDRDQGRSVAP